MQVLGRATTPVTNSASSRRREFSSTRYSRRAAQQPTLDSGNAAVRVRVKRSRIRSTALRMTGLDDNHPVRIHTGGNQHQMFSHPRNQAAGVGEGRHYGDLGVCDSTYHDRRR